VVHLYGGPADMDPIVELCSQHGIVLIEDAAESLGALYKGRQTGTLTPLGIYSFNGNKIITTSGGGMLVGESEEHIERARFLATQAREPAAHYEHATIGYNYRMSNVVAAIGRGQLAALDQRVAGKRAIFEWYRERLDAVDGVTLLPEPSWARSNRWLTCAVVDEQRAGFSAERLRLAFEADNIESRPLWKPMHLQPVFADCPAYTSGVSERLFRMGLCLPSGTAMGDEERARIQRCIESMRP